MNVVQMRMCVRCGSSFRPFNVDDVCCSELCSTAMHTRSLLPAVVPPRAVPVPMARALPSQSRGRSRGPLFVGARFVVFEWQVDQLIRMLGPLCDNFDLHEWFFTLDERVSSSAEIIPQRDGGQWLQARTLEEAQRRGMPVAVSVQSPAKDAMQLRSQYEPWLCPHDPHCPHRTACWVVSQRGKTS